MIDHAKSIGIPNFFMFGEVYSGDAEVLSSFTTTGKLQSVLDFGFQGAVYQSIIANNGTNHLKNLFDNDVNYQDEDSNANQLLNFVGNHDMGRIGYFLNNDEFDFSEAEKIKRTKLAHALMFFARGMPVIYYGDEQGFVGDGGDHDARQDMMASQVSSFNDDDLLATDKTTANDNFDKNHPLYQVFKTYAKVYSEHKGLRHGKHETFFADDKPGIYGFTRKVANSDENYVVVFNTSNEAKSVKLPMADAGYTVVYATAGARLEGNALTVDGLAFAIYRVR